MLTAKTTQIFRPFEPFEPFEFQHGLLRDVTSDAFPTKLYAWRQDELRLPAGSTHYGFVYDGRANLVCSAGEFLLNAGMYFAVPGEAVVRGVGRGIAMSSLGFNGIFQIGGPIEAKGRLKYIDGCTDSLLIPPVLKGDPCLNLLYFPPGIDQTQHTHPSNRIGMVARGHGTCITPDEEIPLVPGQIFIINAHGPHSFRTTDSDMTVIAYHPDSNFGPTHEDHPMINRTIVDGVSASQLSSIRTR